MKLLLSQNVLSVSPQKMWAWSSSCTAWQWWHWWRLHTQWHYDTQGPSHREICTSPPLQSASHLESTHRLADRRSDPYALSHTHTHTHTQTHIPQVFSMMVNSLVENVHQNTPEHVLVLSKRPWLAFVLHNGRTAIISFISLYHLFLFLMTDQNTASFQIWHTSCCYLESNTAGVYQAMGGSEFKTHIYQLLLLLFTVWLFIFHKVFTNNLANLVIFSRKDKINWYL